MKYEVDVGDAAAFEHGSTRQNGRGHKACTITTGIPSEVTSSTPLFIENSQRSPDGQVR
jgi:hypothetical protein